MSVPPPPAPPQPPPLAPLVGAMSASSEQSFSLGAQAGVVAKDSVPSGQGSSDAWLPSVEISDGRDLRAHLRTGLTARGGYRDQASLASDLTQSALSSTQVPQAAHDTASVEQDRMGAFRSFALLGDSCDLRARLRAGPTAPDSAGSGTATADQASPAALDPSGIPFYPEPPVVIAAHDFSPEVAQGHISLWSEV